MSRHRLPKLDDHGRYPVGTVWFAEYADAWLRRTGPWRTQIVDTPEAAYRIGYQSLQGEIFVEEVGCEEYFRIVTGQGSTPNNAYSLDTMYERLAAIWALDIWGRPGR